ncbi:hypothetical protein KEM55_008575 [Ascosphaera atra]|nr:hypothetical protein KEM55_008575 [Ascosphaera atra]
MLAIFKKSKLPGFITASAYHRNGGEGDMAEKKEWNIGRVFSSASSSASTVFGTQRRQRRDNELTEKQANEDQTPIETPTQDEGTPEPFRRSRKAPSFVLPLIFDILLTLVLLMNSSSVFDPVVNLLYAPFQLLTIAIVFLYVCSPLGGQAGLRLLYATNTSSTRIEEIVYLDSGPAGQLYPVVELSIPNSTSIYGTQSQSVYQAGLMQSPNSKLGPRDVWGNVKIPRLSAFDGTEAKSDTNGWFYMDDIDPAVENYFSLFGHPIVSLDKYKDPKVEFTMESAYVQLKCSEFKDGPLHEFNGTYLNVTCPGCSTLQTPLALRRLEHFLDLSWGLNSTVKDNNMPQNLTFHSTSVNSTNQNMGCQAFQELVETGVECRFGKCAATKVRRSRTDHRPQVYTSLDAWASPSLDLISTGRNVSQEEFAAEVNKMMGRLYPTSSQLFLCRSQAVPVLQVRGSSFTKALDMDLSTVAKHTIEARATMLLNAAMLAYAFPASFAGDLSTDRDIYGPPHIPADGLAPFDHNATTAMDWEGSHIFEKDAPFVGASTNATVTTLTAVYKPNYAWCTILMISSLVLFCLGIAGIVCHCKNNAPNMFDPVMSWTYLNPHLTGAGPIVSAERRIQPYKNTKVLLGQLNSPPTGNGNDDERMDGVTYPPVIFGEASNIGRLDGK